MDVNFVVHASVSEADGVYLVIHDTLGRSQCALASYISLGMSPIGHSLL